MNNNDVLVGLPRILCPSCGSQFDIGLDKRIQKYSKKHQINFENTKSVNYTVQTTNDESDYPDLEYFVITCANRYCDQYSRVKLLKLPKIKTPSIKLDLEE